MVGSTRPQQQKQQQQKKEPVKVTWILFQTRTHMQQAQQGLLPQALKAVGRCHKGPLMQQHPHHQQQQQQQQRKVLPQELP
jgi:hypothetical protein